MDAISDLQSLKTGALIVWAAESGAVLGRSDVEPMRRYAADLGLAFQIADDILDVAGDEDAAGKRLGKDAGAGKRTAAAVLGVERTRRLADELTRQAVVALEPLGDRPARLRELARLLVRRTH